MHVYKFNVGHFWDIFFFMVLGFPEPKAKASESLVLNLCAQDELSSHCDELLSQLPGESHEAFARRRQLWTLGVATVWLASVIFKIIFSQLGSTCKPIYIAGSLGALMI